MLPEGSPNTTLELLILGHRSPNSPTFIDISEPTKRHAISHAVLCLKKNNIIL